MHMAYRDSSHSVSALLDHIAFQALLRDPPAAPDPNPLQKARVKQFINSVAANATDASSAAMSGKYSVTPNASA